MASGHIFTIRLIRGDGSSPWGFRLQGGKDFAIPLSVVKVNPNSLADQGGLLMGDVVLKINGLNADAMRHKEAQDVIFSTGNQLELTIQRPNMTTWKPEVTPIGDYRQTDRLINEPILMTKTSLAANKQDFRPSHIGQNQGAKPFVSPNNPSIKLVHNQYNSPINLYSEKKIAETIEAHTELLAAGVKGINFMKPDAPVNTHSPTYQMVHDEEERRLKEQERAKIKESEYSKMTATKHVEAPVKNPFNQNIDKLNRNCCSECGRTIIGPFAKVNDKSLHSECFRCATCGTSLKNVGYFNMNDKLYCDIHAKQVATLMPRTDLDPLSISPGIRTSNYIQTGSTSPNFSTSPLQSSGLSSPSRLGSAPYHLNIQGVHHVNPPTLFSSTNSNTSTFSSVPPPVPAKPRIPNYANYQSASIQSDSNFSWPSKQSATQHFNHDSINETKKISSFNYQTPSAYQSNQPTSYSAQIKMPPLTLPKPQINPPWITNSNLIPGPGQSLRPAPRRGRGLLKPQIFAGTIPVCASCGSPIRGPFIAALNKTWCPDHFTCSYSHCRRSLQDIGFVEEQGQLYCEYCYEAYLAPICSKCNIRIKGDCLNALDKQWHTTCFICAYCKKPFGNSSFYLEDGFPYCEKDWNELFTTKCVRCGYPIEAGDRWVEALNQSYHSQCFKCNVCNNNLEGQSFYAKGGRPYCKSHAR